MNNEISNLSLLLEYIGPDVRRYVRILCADGLRYFIPAGLAFLLLYRVFNKWSAPRRLGPAPQWPQMRREIRYSVMTVFIFAANGYVIWTLVTTGAIEIYRQPDQYGYAYLIFSLVLVVLLHDAYFYVVHRLLHRPWWFARVHRWHHRSVHPTPWAAYAFHPIEALLMAVFLPLVLLLLPLHGAVIAVFLLIMIVRNVIGHCGVEIAPTGRLGRLYAMVFATTVHHHQHHQFGRGNYGLYFRYLDQLFGTERSDYPEAIARFVTQQSGSAVVRGLVLATILVASGWWTVDKAVAESKEADHAASVAGQWWTPAFASRVEIAGCADSLCANIVWLWDEDSAKIGQRVLSDLKLSGDGLWTKGKAYNPEDGQIYRATLSRLTSDRILVTGCVLFLCKRQIWIRVRSLEVIPKMVDRGSE